ncbi:MAG: phosphoribosylaminoimidazolesuccinocarboxamide synthase [Candidatus Bathyarchaeota archaeon]|nr:phosphoribosylaminoimidazolesuccinocarboxamide synthase [Candidatus Termitimicrobium sp.]
MEAVKAKVFEIFDLLPKRKQDLIYELMINLIPDDIATPELIEDHEIAMAEYLRGETVDHEDVDWG